MSKFDLTVYGAGAFGLSCAYEAARRGAKVRVIDPNGVGAGASGGLVGALAPHIPERWAPKKEFQFNSLIMARTHWPEVERIGGLCSGYGAMGRLQGINTDHQLTLAHERAERAKTLWQGKAEWRVLAREDVADWAPRSETGFVIHDTLTARINPAGACRALAAAITALGGEVVRDASEQGAVIHAKGWWGLKELNEAFGREVGNGEKGQAVSLKLSLPDAPQIAGDRLHIIPHKNGTISIGSTTERYFDDPSSTDEQCDDLLARAIVALPQLADAPEIARWAGVRPRSKTRAPMLGAWPERAGHFIANGGFKIGYGMAPLASQILIDLVLEGRDEIPEGFRIEANL